MPSLTGQIWVFSAIVPPAGHVTQAVADSDGPSAHASRNVALAPSGGGTAALLDAHPGAAYLRTDLSCHSLRPRTDQGSEIYAVYTLAGRTQAQLCAAVRAAGGNSYGKWLDNTTDPDHIVPC